MEDEATELLKRVEETRELNLILGLLVDPALIGSLPNNLEEATIYDHLQPQILLINDLSQDNM